MSGRAKQSWPAWLYSFTSVMSRGKRTYDSDRYYKLRGRLAREAGRIIELCLTEGEVKQIVPQMYAWLTAEPFNVNEERPNSSLRPTHLVGCIITDSYGAVLMLHRNTELCSRWELPGGKVNAAELSIDAAKRTVFESTGLEIEVVGAALGNFDYFEDGFRYVSHHYQAKAVGGTLAIHEPDKYDGYGYFNLDQFSTLRGHLSESARQLADSMAAWEPSK